jgi:TPR repeat protein
MKQLLILPVLLLTLLGCTATDKVFHWNKGLTAYDSGDFATALREWMPLAEQGDASAQFNLGLMYAKGQGVLQDYVRAHMWWSIAASSGNKTAVKNRDIIAKEMTPTGGAIPFGTIEDAQKLARECVRKKYKGC